MHNKHKKQRAEWGGGGWRWYHIVRCLLALEGALGGVRTPPAAVAALRGGVVDAGVVIPVGVGDDWGGRGGGGRDDGGWRHSGLVGRSRSLVTLGGLVWREWRRDSPAFISERSPPQPVHPSNQIWTITSPSRRSVILMTLISFSIFQFLISINKNKNKTKSPRARLPWPLPPRVRRWGVPRSRT